MWNARTCIQRSRLGLGRGLRPLFPYEPLTLSASCTFYIQWHCSHTTTTLAWCAAAFTGMLQLCSTNDEGHLSWPRPYNFAPQQLLLMPPPQDARSEILGSYGYSDCRGSGCTSTCFTSLWVPFQVDRFGFPSPMHA